MLHRHLPHISSFRDAPIVFFTVVTAQRRALLNNPEAHDILRGIWERSADANGWWVGHYVLMPDHVHFFARMERESHAMPSWVRMWKSTSARALIKHLHVQAPVWQADYFDRYLRSADNYTEKWNYVRANPVRAGLVEAAEHWPYQGCIHALSY